jgi:hypothetical protein
VTFPEAHASVDRNEAGEPTGWDYPDPEGPYDPDDYLPDQEYDPDDEGE